MNTEATSMFPIRSSARGRSCLPASILIALASVSHADVTEFTGPEVVESNKIYDWEDGDNWSNGVPAPEDDVVIHQALDEFGDLINGFGPTFSDDVTINSLSMEGNTELRNNNANLFVTGTSNIDTVVNYDREFSLGSLLNYNSVTKTLNSGGFIALESMNGANPIIQFRDADIVTNRAFFALFGSNIEIRDQDTGINAFLNLATNLGGFQFERGYKLQTKGNFTNGPNGRIFLNKYTSFHPGDPATIFNIAGNFINDGQVELYANSVFSVGGGLSGSGSIKVLGLPCSLNVLGSYQLNGGTFNFGGTGIDSFTLITTALVVNSGAKVTGTGTSQGSMTVVSGTIAPGNSIGQIQVDGDLNLEAGAILDMEIGGTAHDKLTQSGGTAGTTLGGVLTLATITNFADQVQYDSTYEILASDAPIAGEFSNAPSGTRLSTLGGIGSFQVDYGPSSDSPNKVILSNYMATIFQQSYAQWAADLEVGQDGGSDDPNGDGISNLEAYYRGIPAINSYSVKPIGVTAEAGMLKISIRSPKTVTGVTVSSILTPDFINTQAGPNPVWVSDTPTYNNYEINVPANGPKMFVTLKFELGG